MDEDQLMAFLMTVQEKNFTKAAHILHLSQPSITKRIQALEKDLGFNLFLRNNKKVVLSEPGKAFLPFAENIMNSINEARNSLNRFKQRDVNKIRISTTPILSYYLLPFLLQRLKFNFQNKQFIIKTSRSDDIVNLVKNNEVDFGIITLRYPLHDLESKLLMEDYYTCVLSVNHPLSKKNILTLDLLAKSAIIRYSRAFHFWDPIIKLFATHKIDPTNIIESDTVESIKRMVAREMGISFLPYSALKEELKNNTLVTLPVEDIHLPKRDIALIYKSNDNESLANKIVRYTKELDS